MLEVAVRRRQGSFTVDAAFRVAETGITALFGRSGAGKTSIIEMVAGLARPDEGRIVAAGRVLFDSRKGVDMPPERRRIGCIFQDSRLFPHLTVRGNLDYGRRLLPRAERRLEFDQVVDLLGIGHLLDRRPARLSGGERQRVAIGRALLTSPRLLLMDEPLASLDAPRKAEVLPFIARLPREFDIPILYVSHAVEEVLRLADGMVLLDQGRSVVDGPVEEVLSRMELRPLTGRYEAGAVLRTVVAGHDERYGLTTLRLPQGAALTVGHVGLPPGTDVRVRVHARDVALALEPPARASFQNVLPGTVTEVQSVGRHLIDVCVDVGAPLWAQVTGRARDDLGLAPGVKVYALIKSVAIAGADISGRT